MGFDPNFIQDVEIPLPHLGDKTKASALDGGAPKVHTRVTLVFSVIRGLAIYTAHNIDGATVIPEGVIPRVDRFRLDPSIPSELQVDNDRGYRNNPWDRGHLVRRRSLHWRDRIEAEQADSESFYWSNIAPQHENLHDTAWGQIEDWMLELTDANNRLASVFTGPVLTADDPELINSPGEIPIRIPAGYWKIIAISQTENLKAAGFLVWQRDFDKPTPVAFYPLLEQVRITTIEFLTGLSFGNLRNVDPLQFGVELIERAGRIRPHDVAKHLRSAYISSRTDIVI